VATVVGEGPAPPERRAAYQFSLATILLTIALVAVLLGVLQMAPGVGILLAIAVTPAFLRTCIMTARRKARGKPVSLGYKLGTFAVSVFGMFGLLFLISQVVVVAVFVALFAICLAAMSGGGF
jgi:hypothetical protein